jgi:hypothetical protein
LLEPGSTPISALLGSAVMAAGSQWRSVLRVNGDGRISGALGW